MAAIQTPSSYSDIIRFVVKGLGTSYSKIDAYLDTLPTPIADDREFITHLVTFVNMAQVKDLPTVDHTTLTKSPKKEKVVLPDVLVKEMVKNGCKVVIITDVRERSHAMFGDTEPHKILFGEKPKALAVFTATDKTYGPGWFFGKRRLSDVILAFKNANVPVHMMTDLDAKNLIKTKSVVKTE